MSKTEAAEYIGVCRATFDNYVKNGYIPRGTSSHKDTKTLFWWKSDLD
jgi:predicted site-specific integrase-resolvase